jgi:hypothetical protein
VGEDGDNFGQAAARARLQSQKQFSQVSGGGLVITPGKGGGHLPGEFSLFGGGLPVAGGGVLG